MNTHETAVEETLDAIGDPALRRAIGQLFADAQAMIDRGEVNLVILAARRLACLYHLLTRAGMPPINNCVVVSDRILDADPYRDWSGKRVLILDDSVIVGTTLARLHDDLADRIGSPGHIRCRAVCLDVDQHAPYLFKGMDFAALERRSGEETQAFSRELVTALFRHQVPFFSDFASTKPITLSRSQWKNHLANPGWYAADVTAPLLGGPELHAYAQVPRQETIDRFLSRVPSATASLLDSFKVRSYVRETGDALHVVLVSLAMVAPCRPAALNDSLEEIEQVLRRSPSSPKRRWVDWSPEAKHRLVQLYLSACALAELWPSLEVAADLTLDADVLEPLPVSLYFGGDADTILDSFSAAVQTYRSIDPGTYTVPAPLRLDQPTLSPLLDADGVQEVLWEARELLAVSGLPDEPSQGELTKIGLIFSHAIAGIFGHIDRELERPQRKEIAELKSRAEYDEYFRDPGRRVLTHGLTMRELTAALAPDLADGSPWQRSLISLGIDGGNDLGIVVPITLYDETRDIAYRCYRIGETTQLTERSLPAAVRDGRFDALAKSVDDGYPIHSYIVSIDESGAKAAEAARTSSSGELTVEVRKGTPGTLLSCYEGTVTDIDMEQGYFGAELRNPVNGDERVAELRIAQIPEAQLAALEPGASFTWSVFQNDFTSARDRISRIQIRVPHPLDHEQLLRSTEGLAERLRADDIAVG